MVHGRRRGGAGSGRCGSRAHRFGGSLMSVFARLRRSAPRGRLDRARVVGVCGFHVLRLSQGRSEDPRASTSSVPDDDWCAGPDERQARLDGLDRRLPRRSRFERDLVPGCARDSGPECHGLSIPCHCLDGRRHRGMTVAREKGEGDLAFRASLVAAPSPGLRLLSETECRFCPVYHRLMVRGTIPACGR